jgi:retron-type reverse transcriptase
MESLSASVEVVASILVATRQEADRLLEAFDHVFDRRWRWPRTLVARYLHEFGSGPRPLAAQVKAFLIADKGFRRAVERHGADLRSRRPWQVEMAPVSGPPSQWKVPPITSTAGLANLLGISLGELDWFADVHNWNCRHQGSRLHHYHLRVIAKHGKGVRLIEAPKSRLKAVQRWILREIMDHIPPHRVAHGFCRTRSIYTYSAPHVAKSVVLKLDLKDFFPSIRAAQVRSIFRTAGYPESVADCLTALCTTSTADSVWDDHRDFCCNSNREVKWLYVQRHLPQGAPTSPALANLAAFRLDSRLSGLARSAGAAYTRYADDFAFSGGDNFARRVSRFYLHAAATIAEEGFRVHHRKTRIMRQGVRQQVAGLVLNRRINVRREEYEQLKAILYNCVRHGPASQNRRRLSDFRSHLLGRIQFVRQIHEVRGRRLSTLFEQITW